MKQPRVGIAHSAYVSQLVRERPQAVDFVELPFELMHYSARPVALPPNVPLLLHSSSLSLAGTVPPPPELVDAVADWARRTRTPWLGEHLAFISADAPEPFAAGEPVYDVGYTINPPMNAETVSTVATGVAAHADRVGVPFLLENPPVYFVPPGSTMSPTEFTNAVCDATPAGLLIDLAHFYITCMNLGDDPVTELLALPLERVVEVHLSGVATRAGAWWDDHTVTAPDEAHELLRLLVGRTHVAAVTLEYNWNGGFSVDVVLDELARVRRILSGTAVSA